MNYDILKRRSKRARSLYRQRQTQLSHSKSEMTSASDRYQTELGETKVAEGVLGEAQQRGLGDFEKTESGQILKRFTGRTGIKLGKVASANEGQLRTWGRKYQDAYRRNNTNYDEWSSTLGAKGKLDFHFQGGGKQSWGYQPGSADANRGMRQTLREVGYNRNVNDLVTTKHGTIEKESQGRGCNPFAKSYDNRSDDIRSHIEGRVSDRYSKIQKDQDVVGILTGTKKGKYGRDQNVGNLQTRKGFQDYKKSFASESKSFEKEKSESDMWEKVFGQRKTMFSSAKTEFDEASSTYATAKQAQRRFERMEGTPLKPSKFKRGKAGAGSYIA